MVSTLVLSSYVWRSSTVMALERSLLVGESGILLWLTSAGLSSDRLLNLSPRSPFLSEERLLARVFPVKASSLQEPRTFPSGGDSF